MNDTVLPPPSPPPFDPGPAPAMGPADFGGGTGGGSYDPGPAASQQEPTVIIQQVDTSHYGDTNIAVDSFGQYIVTGALAFGMAGAYSAAVRGFNNPGAPQTESAAAAYGKLPPLENRWWPMLRSTGIASLVAIAVYGLINHRDTIARIAAQPVSQTFSLAGNNFEDAASFVTGHKSQATINREKANKYSGADRWKCELVLGDKELMSRKNIPNLRIGNDAQMLIADPNGALLHQVYKGEKIQGIFTSKFGNGHIVVRLAPRNSSFEAVAGATGKDACVLAATKDIMVNKETGQVFYQVPEAARPAADPAAKPAAAAAPKQ